MRNIAKPLTINQLVSMPKGTKQIFVAKDLGYLRRQAHAYATRTGAKLTCLTINLAVNNNLVPVLLITIIKKGRSRREYSPAVNAKS